MSLPELTRQSRISNDSEEAGFALCMHMHTRAIILCRMTHDMFACHRSKRKRFLLHAHCYIFTFTSAVAVTLVLALILALAIACVLSMAVALAFTLAPAIA